MCGKQEKKKGLPNKKANICTGAAEKTAAVGAFFLFQIEILFPLKSIEVN